MMHFEDIEEFINDVLPVVEPPPPPPPPPVRRSVGQPVPPSGGEPECRDTSKSSLRRLQSQINASPSQAVNLSSPDYAKKLAMSMYQHQQDGTFCDFKLVLDSGREVPVHKMVLSSISTYFSCLFQSQMLETQVGFVNLKGMKDETVLELLKFIYTGKLCLSKENIVDVVDASCHLQVEPAIKLCSSYMMSAVHKGNCVEVYNTADKYSLAKVKASVFGHMSLKFTQLPEEQLLLLNAEQITSLIESDRLVCASEWDVFVKVEKWLRNIDNEDERTAMAEKLMKLIRFPLMSGEELVSKVSRVDLMKTDACNRILTEAKDYHIVVPTQPYLQTRRTKVRHAEIIYMAVCQEMDFFAYPMMSPLYRLGSQRPVELRKPPRSLIQPTITVYNNFLYACGGVHEQMATTISSARCFRFDPRTDSWFEISSMNESRQRFDLEVVGDYMFALGGWDDSIVSNTYEVYNFAKDEWRISNLPNGYHSPARHATVSYAQSIYASGGSMGAYTSSAMVQYVHDVRSPGTLLVRQLPKMRKARKRHRMFAHKEKIFVLGGGASSVEVFDTITEQWRLYEGFTDSLGTLNMRLSGVCALDPTRIILVSYRDNKSNSMLVNLDKDPDTEKQQFAKKLNEDPGVLSISISSFGAQIWMPALVSVTSKKETTDTS